MTVTGDCAIAALRLVNFQKWQYTLFMGNIAREIKEYRDKMDKMEESENLRKIWQEIDGSIVYYAQVQTMMNKEVTPDGYYYGWNWEISCF